MRGPSQLEYHLVLFDEEKRTVQMACIAPEVLAALEAEDDEHDFPQTVTWHPEYGSWMVEATPGQPYGRMTSDLRTVEPNMAFRRARIQGVLDRVQPAARPLSSVVFPLMGVGGAFTFPAAAVGGFHSRSEYFSDLAISPHPRFGTLTANIRRRRGERVCILLPVFPDTKTDLDRPVTYLDEEAQLASGPQPLYHTTHQVPLPDEETQGEEEVAEGAAAAVPPPLPHHDAGGIRHSETPHMTLPSMLLEAAARQATDGALGSASADSSEAPVDQPTTVLGGGTHPTRLPPPPKSAATAAACLKGPPVFTSRADVGLDVQSDAASAASAGFLPPGWVHGDAMGFGMGCCCLQVTFQARDLRESRFLYDQLAILAPILLALTANTPIFRGRLLNTDTRWDIIAASVDCRTPSERQGALGMNGLPRAAELARSAAAAAVRAGEAESPSAATMTPAVGAAVEAAPAFPHGDGAWGGEWPAAAWQRDASPAEVAGAAGAGVRGLPKSRYDSVSLFLSESKWALPAYNDVQAPIDQGAYAQLVAGGVDDKLAQHIAHLFIRDPLVIFTGAISEVDDDASTEHFENIQSTNWQSVRWKPPPPDREDIGWRVEIRTMEVQLTDFENAAFTVFTVLASRVILFFDLNMYVPMSLVQENFARARAPGAVSQGKFWFRRNVTPLAEQSKPAAGTTSAGAGSGAPAVDWEEMSMAEIVLGKGSDGPSGASVAFPGLIPLIFAYLDIINCDAVTRMTVDGYLRLVADRARGIAQSGATWTRAFVQSHPDYKQDSVVSPSIAHDLLRRMDDVASGKVIDKDLLCAAAELHAANAAAAQSDAALGQGGAEGGPEAPGAAIAPVARPSSDALLRGASFAEELRSVQDCLVLQSLVSQYTIKSSFADTPAFLPQALFTSGGQ